MKQRRKIIAGTTLLRRDEHEWVARFGGHDVVFYATLGRYNRKVNGWKACSEEKIPGTTRAVFATSGATLTICIQYAQEHYGTTKCYNPDDFKDHPILGERREA